MRCCGMGATWSATATIAIRSPSWSSHSSLTPSGPGEARSRRDVAMTEKLEERLKELQKEYEAGQKMLTELDTKRSTLTSTLLRIEGAMQILREMIGSG